MSRCHVRDCSQKGLMWKAWGMSRWDRPAQQVRQGTEKDGSSTIGEAASLASISCFPTNSSSIFCEESTTGS